MEEATACKALIGQKESFLIFAGIIWQATHGFSRPQKVKVDNGSTPRVLIGHEM